MSPSEELAGADRLQGLAGSAEKGPPHPAGQIPQIAPQDVSLVQELGDGPQVLRRRFLLRGAQHEPHARAPSQGDPHPGPSRQGAFRRIGQGGPPGAGDDDVDATVH